MWRCGNCGFVWDGDEPPEQCPKCEAGKEKYGVLGDKAAELIDGARYTNSLHMQLYVLLEQLMDLAEDGIDEHLDANCVKIFGQVLDEAEMLQQSIKAELQAHVSKGKWG